MAVGSESLQGARLEFVLRPLPGTILVKKTKAPPSKRMKEKNPEIEDQNSNVINLVREEAGYMVFFPNGSCYRLSTKEAKRRGFLDRRPTILNLESVKDTTSPAGMFKYALEESEKKRAYKLMEDEIIKKCSGRAGGQISGLIADECEYDPKGKIDGKAA